MMEWTDNHFRMLARIISKNAWLYSEMLAAETIVYQKGNLVSRDLLFIKAKDSGFNYYCKSFGTKFSTHFLVGCLESIVAWQCISLFLVFGLMIRHLISHMI